MRLPALRPRQAWAGLVVLLTLLFGIGLRLPATPAVTPAELDAVAAAAGRQVETSLAQRLAAVLALGRAWEASGLEPGSAAAGDWLEAARQGLPGALWLGVADDRGIIRADSGNRLIGAEVGHRDWFLRGREAPGLLPAHEAILLRPLFQAAGQEPDRMFDFVAPVRGPDGTVRGVLGVHVPERALAETLRAALPDRSPPVRLVILDRAGTLVLGAGLLTPGLERRSSPIALTVPGAAELGWTLQAEALPAAAATPDAAVWLFAAAALLLAGVTGALAWHLRRSLRAAGPGWRGRLRRAPPAALLAAAAALVLLGAAPWWAGQRRQTLEVEAAAAAGSLVELTLERQRVRLTNLRTLHAMAALVSEALRRGDAAGAAAALQGLRDRLRLPDSLGLEVMGLSATGSPLWQTALSSFAALPLDRADLGPILAGEADLAYGRPDAFGEATRRILPISGAARDPGAALLGIAVIGGRVAAIAAGLTEQLGQGALANGFAAGPGDLIALARDDGAVLVRSDGRGMPGDSLPAGLVAAVAAAKGAPVLLRDTAPGGVPGRLVAARRLMPDGLVTVVSLDLAARRAAEVGTGFRLRAAACGLAALLLAYALARLQAGRLRRDRDALALAAAMAERDARFLRAFADNLQESVSVLDAEGRIRFHNAQAVRLFGAERMAGAIGRRLGEVFVDMSHRPAVDSRVQAATAGATLPPATYSITGPDGRTVIFEGRVHPLPAEVQDVLGGCTIASALDVTTRAAAEAARDAAEARVAQLLAAMPGVLLEFAAGPDGTEDRVTYASPSIERLIGWTEAEAQAPGWWAALTLDAPEVRIATLLPALRQAGEAVLTVPFRCRLALHREASISFRLVRREAGERVIAYFADVTAEREARARLGQMAQSGLIGDIAVGFSHEVNQPLSIISMGLQNLQRSLRRLLPAEEAMHARVQRMIEQSLRVGRMTEEFRGLRGAAGGEHQALDAPAVLQAVATLLAPEAAAAGVALRLDLPAGLPAALGQLLSLRQALIELVRAAVGAYAARDGTAAEAVVTLAARVEGEALVLSVADAAGPIPAALLGQVFLPFAPIRTLAPSGGLGLAKCRQAALAMQAGLGAVNAGAGVRFELRLALAPAAEAVPAG